MIFLRKKQLFYVPSRWTEVPCGKYYRKTLESYLKAWWPKINGSNMLNIGALSANLNIIDRSNIYQIDVGFEGDCLEIVVDPYKMPFSNGSIDICLLIHTLSYIQNPYLLLQEIDRILSDDGWVVISTFNLLSILGVLKIIYFFFRKSYEMRFYTQMRLLYWLRLLNFDVIYCTHLQLFPWKVHNCHNFLNKDLLFFGCLNLIIARKSTISLQLVPLSTL